MSSATATTAFTLRAGLRTGLVHVPGEPGYDEHRVAWNLAVDQRPAAVATPRTAAEVVRADAQSHPELLKAIRAGAGVGLGVVTAMEFELLAIEATQAGVLWFPAPRGEEILDAWAAWAPQLPDTVATNLRWMTFPPLPQLPEHLRGQSFCLVEAVVIGDAGDADAVLAPMRALEPIMDTVVEMDAVAMLDLHMDPPGPVPTRGEGCVLRSLPTGAAAPIAQAYADTSALLFLQFALAGGALSRIDGEIVVFSAGAVMAPELDAVIGADIETVLAALAPHRAQRDFANFCESARAPERLWDAETLASARAARDTVDPDGIVLTKHAV